MEIKRLTAKKASISELTTGKFFQKPGFESNYILSVLGRKLSRIRVMALVVDKFISEDGKYGAITLDDSTDTIRCKIFIDIDMFDNINAGDLVDVVGKVRKYNDEVYIAPEIVKKIDDPNWETLRMLELEKITIEQKEKIKRIKELQKQTSDLNELKKLSGLSLDELEGIIEAQSLIEQSIEERIEKERDAKDVILKILENYDSRDGVDYQLLLEKSNLKEDVVDSAIRDLLENGICFEPRPGKIKKL